MPRKNVKVVQEFMFTHMKCILYKEFDPIDPVINQHRESRVSNKSSTSLAVYYIIEDETSKSSL